MRALVTGGAGFVGSHLCEFFLKKGFSVICMDNLITGDLSNISHLKVDRDFKFVKHDVSKHIKVDGELDYVLHFASPASPSDYMRFPIQTLKAGSLGTRNALGLAMVKKAVFLLASTSEVYGDPLVHPQKEDYWGNVNPIGPRGVYDEAKRFAEAITMAYHKFHGVNTKIARIFNTYGPRMRLNDGRVVPNFIYQALNSKPLTVYGDGSQSRSFCYIDDLLDGIYRLLMSGLNEPVNLGNPRELKILDFASLVLNVMKEDSKIEFKTLPMDDPKSRQPDISKAKQELGWEPKIGLEDGLARTIVWFKFNVVINGGAEPSKRTVMDALHDVIDPEVGISLVEMNLIKDVDILKTDAGSLVKVKIKLTSPECPLVNFLTKAVRDRVKLIPGVAKVKVEVLLPKRHRLG